MIHINTCLTLMKFSRHPRPLLNEDKEGSNKEPSRESPYFVEIEPVRENGEEDIA